MVLINPYNPPRTMTGTLEGLTVQNGNFSGPGGIGELVEVLRKGLEKGDQTPK